TIDIVNKALGLLLHTYDVDRNTLVSMIKGTVVEHYKIVELENLKKEADALQPISKAGKLKITIDHCFDVKGVGTVILGKVTQGKVRVYDNLKFVPTGIDVVIKSIQMHDDSVDEASSPAR